MRHRRRTSARPSRRWSLAGRPARPWPVPDIPLILRILWVNYAVVVVINLAVWLAVNVGSPDPEYFWPAWMVVPGVVLAGAPAGVHAVRRNRTSRSL